MSRDDDLQLGEPTALDYVTVIRLDGADHWYRPPVGNHVFPAVSLATYPGGNRLILFLLGNTPVPVQDVPVKVKGTGCCWPMDGRDPASSLAGRLDRLAAYLDAQGVGDTCGPGGDFINLLAVFSTAAEMAGDGRLRPAAERIRDFAHRLRLPSPDPARRDLTPAESKLVAALLDAWEAEP